MCTSWGTIFVVWKRFWWPYVPIHFSIPLLEYIQTIEESKKKRKKKTYISSGSSHRHPLHLNSLDLFFLHCYNDRSRRGELMKELASSGPDMEGRKSHHKLKCPFTLSLWRFRGFTLSKFEMHEGCNLFEASYTDLAKGNLQFVAL